MNTIIYLVVQGKKSRYQGRSLGSVKTTKNKPSTNADEIAVRLDLDIPDSLFEKPSLQAKITVPNLTQVGSVITADIEDNIAEIIKRETGFTVSVSAVEEGES